VQQLRWKKKISTQKTSTTRKARRTYGPEAVKVTDDVSTDDLNKLEEEYMEKHINLSAQKCENITKNTIQQSQPGLWHSERKARITASNVGSIVRRNPSLPIEFFFRNMLYSSFNGNHHTRTGILQENTTIEENKLKKVEENENVCVNPCGLVIHPTYTYLDASPDGIVCNSTGEIGLIEIKNLLHSKPINLWQASENKNLCSKYVNGKLHL
jgi:hypothetical protein